MKIYITKEDPATGEDKTTAYEWSPNGAAFDKDNVLWLGPGMGEMVNDDLTYIAIPWDDIKTMVEIYKHHPRYTSPQTEGVKKQSAK